jgi:hypothetical protein
MRGVIRLVLSGVRGPERRVWGLSASLPYVSFIFLPRARLVVASSLAVISGIERMGHTPSFPFLLSFFPLSFYFVLFVCMGVKPASCLLSVQALVFWAGL